MSARHALPRRIAHRAWRELRGHWPPLRDAPAILMYHRVAEPPWDPWGLCVSPSEFRDQVGALLARRTIMSMDELVRGLQTGKLPRRATALTFDDGYADNMLVAAPILAELGAPATFFLTSGFVSAGERFWWDELALMVLAGPGAADFVLEAGVTPLALQWPEQDSLPDDLSHWRVGDPTTHPRRTAYATLWHALQPMDSDQRSAALAELRRKIGGDPPLEQDALGIPMDAAMIRVAPAVISFGAHGRSHTPLTGLPLVERRSELKQARSEIAALANSGPPLGMAYPHGSFDRETRELVAEAGYRWAVTSRSARVDRREYDPLALPRLELGRRSGRAMFRALHVAGR